MTSEGQASPDPANNSQQTKRPTRRKRERRELRVVLDTNALFTGSASDLVRQEAANLINESRFPDLDVQWYLPEIVRLERQFQMQKSALELLAPVAKVEKLLGHKLNITEAVLISNVDRVIRERQSELGLIPLKPTYSQLDWERLVLDSAFRRAPFQDGKTEKGFRDSIIVESFMHLLNTSPRTAKVCRIAMVTEDALLTQALRNRATDAANVEILRDLDALRGLINVLASTVDDEFLNALREKATKLFFIPDDQRTLIYKHGIRDSLTKQFARELAALPVGATSRTNGTWTVFSPNFSKKVGPRVHWTSRIEIACEASRREASQENLSAQTSVQDVLKQVDYLSVNPYASNLYGTPYPGFLYRASNTDIASAIAHYGAVRTHSGKDVYDVLWSANVTKSRDLRRPSIDDIVHVDTIWEPIG